MRTGVATGPRVGALLVAIVLIGLNLRAPIVGVPPLIPALSADLGLTGSAAGLLTSLPLLCFAVVSPLVVPLVRRVGLDRALLLAVALLALATAVRPWAGFALLLAGTALVGVAITVGNVVVPIVVRRDAGVRTAVVMAVSTSSYGVGQATAAALAVPVANQAGWRTSMALLAVPAAVALVVWLRYLRRRTRDGGRGAHGAVPAPAQGSSSPVGAPIPAHGTSSSPAGVQTPAQGNVPPAGAPIPAHGSSSPSGPPAPRAGRRRPPVWRQPDAWWLATFFGLQALLFYSASTWLPALLAAETGASDEAAGTALSLFHLLGIGGTLLVPLLVRRARGAVGAGIVVALAWATFFVGLAVAPASWPVWIVVGGLAQGAGIGLGMTLIAVRPVDADYGHGLSAMVQSAGYGLAAVGPVLLGWVQESTGSWTVVSWTAAAGGALMGVAALRAGADRTIGSND